MINLQKFNIKKIPLKNIKQDQYILDGIDTFSEVAKIIKKTTTEIISRVVLTKNDNLGKLITIYNSQNNQVNLSSDVYIIEYLDGYLTPRGKFIELESMGHRYFAENIIYKNYEKEFKTNWSYRQTYRYEDYIEEVLGYIKFSTFAGANMFVTNSYEMILNKFQWKAIKEFANIHNNKIRLNHVTIDNINSVNFIEQDNGTLSYEHNVKKYPLKIILK